MIAHTVRRLTEREAELSALLRDLPRGSEMRREMMRIRRETRQLRAWYAAQLERREPGGS